MKDAKLLAFLISKGKAFHRTGAENLKQREPYVDVRGLCTVSRCLADELRARDCAQIDVVTPRPVITKSNGTSFVCYSS